MLALALLLVVVTPVLANDELPTDASVDPCGTPPFIKAKWELSENDDPDRAGIQIIPNPSDTAFPGEPGETEICVYAVVTDPNGALDVTGVYFNVYYPDGTPKLTFQGMSIVTDPDEIHEAKRGAVLQGDLTPEECHELDEEIAKHDAYMWMGCWIYHTHQPAGCYDVEVVAVDQAGNSSEPLWNCLCVDSIVVLALDFAAVNFGSILPDTPKWVPGDDNFVPGDGKPTVWNLGNDPAALCIHFTAMEGVNTKALIEDFDVQLLGQILDLHACDTGRLDGPLEGCDPVQIDFSIHPPRFLPGDTYEGVVSFAIVHDYDPCPTMP